MKNVTKARLPVYESHAGGAAPELGDEEEGGEVGEEGQHQHHHQAARVHQVRGHALGLYKVLGLVSKDLAPACQL